MGKSPQRRLERTRTGRILRMAPASFSDNYCEATTVCVTGAEGFVGSCLVKRLLEKGYNVHATVRRAENEAEARHFLDISGTESEKRLKLFKGELSEEGSFDDAICGCHGVFHVATPTDLAPKDPENDVIKPAVNGTLDVLKACTKSKTVKRVVVTSSAAAVSIHESLEQNQCIDESCWSDVDFLQTKNPPGWAYMVSKILAEQAALQYGKEHHDLDVVIINIGFTLGSCIAPNIPMSVQGALSLFTGNSHGLQALKDLQMLLGTIPVVHVDDVCSAHIFLMENPAANGRYICCPINTSVPQLANYLSKRYPQYNVPTGFENFPSAPRVHISSKKLIESGFSFKLGIDEVFDDSVEYYKTKGLIK